MIERLRSIDRRSPIPILLGVGLMISGLAVIAYTWGRVAGVLSVSLQLPYLVSGGIGGLTLVVVGALAVHLGVARQEGAARDDKLAELAAALRRVDAPTPEAEQAPVDRALARSRRGRLTARSS